MTYREYYWQKAREQAYYAWYVFWNGVVRNRGHHSGWNKR